MDHLVQPVEGTKCTRISREPRLLDVVVEVGTGIQLQDARHTEPARPGSEGFLGGEEAEKILQPDVVLFARCREIEIELLQGKCARGIAPLARELRRVAASKADVQSGEALLAVEHRADGNGGRDIEPLGVARRSFMVMANELEERELGGRRRRDVPKEERADGIAPHEAVEEPADLLR